jgi:hypothetical protein
MDERWTKSSRVPQRVTQGSIINLFNLFLDDSTHTKDAANLRQTLKQCQGSGWPGLEGEALLVDRSASPE